MDFAKFSEPTYQAQLPKIPNLWSLHCHIAAIFMQMSFLALFQRNKSNYFIDLWLYQLIENQIAN